MKQCSSCGKKQETGNFCGACGEKLEVMRDEEQTSNSTDENSPQAATGPAASLDRMEAAAADAPQPDLNHTSSAGAVSSYWQYFLEMLKKPASTFRKDEHSFLNGLINILVFIATFALGLYFVTNGLYKISYGILSDIENLPFFELFIRFFAVSAIFIATTFITIFLFEKLVVKRTSVKELIAQYGGMFAPLIAVNLLASITVMSGSMFFTIFLLGTSLFVATIIYGIVYIYEKITYYCSTEYKLYVSIGVLLLNSLIIYVMMRIAVIQSLDILLDELNYFF